MNRAAPQTECEAFAPRAGAPERGVEHGIVIRQHGDDDIAVEQIGAIGRRPEAESGEFQRPVRVTDVGDDFASEGREVCGHGHAHAAEADKADLGLFLQADGWAGIGREGAEFVDQRLPPARVLQSGAFVARNP